MVKFTKICDISITDLENVLNDINANVTTKVLPIYLGKDIEDVIKYCTKYKDKMELKT